MNELQHQVKHLLTYGNPARDDLKRKLNNEWTVAKLQLADAEQRPERWTFNSDDGIEKSTYATLEAMILETQE